MSLSWFEKLMPTSIRTDSSTKRGVPEGLWTKCASCSAVLYRAELERNLDVCPKCNHHMRVFGRKRIAMFLDEGPAEEIGANLVPFDKLKFKDSKKYKDRLLQAQKNTDEKDALIVGPRVNVYKIIDPTEVGIGPVEVVHQVPIYHQAGCVIGLFAASPSDRPGHGCGINAHRTLLLFRCQRLQLLELEDMISRCILFSVILVYIVRTGTLMVFNSTIIA